MTEQIDRRRRHTNGAVYCPIASDWWIHREEAKTAMTQVETMSENMHHLAQLSTIADTLKGMKTDLVGPATGRKQIPLMSHLVTLVILGAALLIVLAERSTKSVRISASGIEITQRHEEKAQ